MKLRSLSLALALTLLAGGPAMAAPATDAGQNDEVLVELRVDQQILSDSLAARQGSDGGLLLPLGALSQASGLAITVQPADGTASGFVLHEDRKFSLDARHGVAVLAGRELPYDASQVVVRDDDVYVDLRLLARWLPIGFEFDRYNLVVRLNPREPLPAQARLERERRAQEGGEQPQDPNYPLVATPYALFGQPAIDPSLGFTYNRDEHGQLRPGVTYAGLADVDLLGMNVSGYATGNDRTPVLDWHATAGRRDPDGGLLGPLRARQAEVGYVLDQGIPLLAGTWTGNGAIVSNYPLTQPTRFDRQSFRGALPPGWDAQLFQNGFPIAYYAASSTGEYRFDDVPLVVGPNEFRIVLNGPQGERREEVRRFNIGATLTPKGEVRYRATQGIDPLGQARTVALVEHGFTSELTGAAGAARMTLADGSTHTYALTGLRGTLGELFWHVDGAAREDGGVAAEVGTQVAAGLLGVSLDQTVARGFTSEEFRPDPDPVMARSTGRLDARTPDGFAYPATLALTGTLERRVSGLIAPLIDNQLSARVGALTLSNTIGVDPTLGGPFTEGASEVSGLWHDVTIRGQAFYSPRQLTALALVTSGTVGNGYRWTTGVTYPLITHLPELSLDVSHAFGALTADVNVTGVYPDSVTTALSLSSGLSWGGNGVLTSASSLATTGAVRLQAFVDANQNGKFDPGERVLPNLLVDLGTGVPVRTDARGQAYATGLAAYLPVDADFTRVALDDPLLVPALKGARYVPRPGRVTELTLPVVAVGEVYGTVRVVEGDRPREFSGATLELLDPAGRLVTTTVTGLDGYYGLTELRPGRYTLRIAPDQLAKLGYKALPPREIVIPGEGSVVDGQDFALRR